MPSWQHLLHADVLPRLTGARRRGSLLHLPELLSRSAQVGEAGPPGAPDLRVERRLHRGRAVWVVTPAEAAEDAPVVVLVHGGGHVQGLRAVELRCVAALARRCGARVVVPLLPPVPAGTADAVVPSVAALVRHVLAEHPGARTTVLGISSGGGVALAALQLLSASGRSTPDHLVLVSPWLDAAVPAGDGAPRRDPLLHVDQLRETGRLWAGQRSVHDPLVSPVHGCVQGLPPMTVFSGTRDVLHPDSVRLAQRARRQGAPVDLRVGEHLVHEWVLLTRTPEGAAASAEVHALVTARSREVALARS